MIPLAFKLQPLDLLFFRDGHPFGAADQGRSRMPLPQTWAGLIKTHLTHTLFGGESSVWHGGHDRSQPRESWPWQCRLQFRGPWLWVEDPSQLFPHPVVPEESSRLPQGPLIPAPADLVRIDRGNGESRLSRLRPLNREQSRQLGWRPPAQCGELVPLWHTGMDSIEPVKGLLDPHGLSAYLRGGVPDSANVHEISRFLDWEPRTGIGIDSQRQTADEERGLIYSAVFLRLRAGVCWYGELDWPEDAPTPEEVFPNDLTLPWGGEGRRVLLERCRQPWCWSELETAPEEGRLLTLLITPGIFTNGRHTWKPQERGSMVGAAIPQPLPVSGWDLAGDRQNGHRSRPRPTRFAVPAGATYLWRQGERTLNQPPPRQPESLCDKPSDQDAGWGVVLRGRWNFLEQSHHSSEGVSS